MFNYYQWHSKDVREELELQKEQDEEMRNHRKRGTFVFEG
jgi:hypothetical protein